MYHIFSNNSSVYLDTSIARHWNEHVTQYVTELLLFSSLEPNIDDLMTQKYLDYRVILQKTGIKLLMLTVKEDSTIVSTHTTVETENSQEGKSSKLTLISR